MDIQDLKLHGCGRIVTLATAAVFSAVINVQAQNSPVGIVSVQDSVKSVQFGVISSVAVDGGHGVQLSGVSNTSAHNLKGLQLSGVSNITAGMDKGVQLSGVLNVSSAMQRGLQLGAINYADSLNGVQIGVFNIARKHPKGWQVGLVNLSYDSIGHKIGLVNINPMTTIDYMLYGGSSTKVNLAARYRNKNSYSIFGVGTHFMGLDSKFSGALFYRLGLYKQLSPKWSLSGDVGYYHVETFSKNNSEKPERLYSLQARLNADYQFSKKFGAFASAGWGVTRYYDRNETYRNRPLVEMGLTYRQPRNQHDTWKQAWEEKRSKLVYADSTMALPTSKRPWQALAEVTGINVFVQLFDRYVTSEEFAQTTLRSIKRNFTDGMVWDNDLFNTNMFMHPYHGNLYFNAARTNGLSFWESAPFSLLGSAMWEFLGETEPPAINDIIATTCGGIAIGEISHRLSLTVLDDRERGFKRFMREAVATIVNPIQGLHRIISGDAWRVKSKNYRYHNFKETPIDMSFSVGWRYLADDGALFRGLHAPYINATLTYGTSVDGAKGKGLVTVSRGARLIYTPAFEPGNRLELDLWADPCKTGGQGFGSATGQYFDVGIGFDLTSLSGYAVRIERTPAHDNAVEFSIVKYDHGQTTVVSERKASRCFRTGFHLHLTLADGKLTATGERKGDRVEIETDADICGKSIYMQHTGTCGASALMLHKVKMFF